MSHRRFLPGAFPEAHGGLAKNRSQEPPRLVSDPSFGHRRARTVQGKCLFRNIGISQVFERCVFCVSHTPLGGDFL